MHVIFLLHFNNMLIIWREILKTRHVLGVKNAYCESKVVFLQWDVENSKSAQATAIHD